MPVKITVTRYGGIMAMKPVSKSFTLEILDAATREELARLINTKIEPPSASQRWPDAFSYKFEMSDGAEFKKEVEVSGPQIPELLRKLLP